MITGTLPVFNKTNTGTKAGNHFYLIYFLSPASFASLSSTVDFLKFTVRLKLWPHTRLDISGFVWIFTRFNK